MFVFVLLGFFLFLGGNLAVNTTVPNVPNRINEAVNATSEEDAYYPFQDWSDIFDWQLLKAFSNPQYKNVIISPISLKLILALLYEGASGATEKEFQNVLQFPEQKETLRENYVNVLDALKPSEKNEYLLNLGTRIFLDSSVSAQQLYASKAEHFYQTKIEGVNFNDETVAAETINSWVRNLTVGQVPNLLNPDELKSAIMILVNAIFFKGTWRHQFPKNRTAVQGFYVSPSVVVNVPYMSTTDRFFYCESTDLDAKILRMPYQGKKFALFIVLPNSKGGLAGLIKKVNLQVLKRQLYLMDEVPVEVSIPKFKFDFQARYTDILQQFGLRQMFQNTASFPGIARGETNLLRMLYVSDIIQKAGIQIDEEGSVVYAASDVQVVNKFGEIDNIFNATHPFMFFIEEQIRGSIIFVGKMENPLEMEPIPIPPRTAENTTPSPASVRAPMDTTVQFTNKGFTLTTAPKKN